MVWSQLFRAWRRRSHSPPSTDVEQDIDEELMFHLRSLVGDDLAKGNSFDAAWSNAQDRFGPLRRYSDACRNVSLANRLNLRRLSVLGLVVVGLLVGESLFAVFSPRRNDVTGWVLDRHGEPLADANVLVILKTWPGGGYRQEAFATTSDAEGRFHLPTLAPLEGQYAIQVAALKDGYALTSSYQLEEEGRHPTVDPVTLHCGEASRITLVVHDGHGQPIANARVVPASRKTSSGETHLVYFQGSEPVQTASDAQGRVGLSCFERGDQAEIYVRPPGKDWELHAIRIPDAGNIVVVSAAQIVDGDDSSNSEIKSPG